MIEIKNLSVQVAEKTILNDISFQIEEGKNYLLLGRNGSGKSSISSFLMGNPKYKKLQWSVIYDGQDIETMEVDARSKAGLFLSFQNVPELVGVNVRDYLRTIYNASLSHKHPETKPLTPFVFKRFIKKFLDELQIDESFLERDLNVWFSGGEKRKIEILQAKLLEPKYIILDEIDSGLDIDAFKVVAGLVAELNSPKNSIIVITHHFKISEYIPFDEVLVLKGGRLERQWGLELLDEIQEKGFE